MTPSARVAASVGERRTAMPAERRHEAIVVIGDLSGASPGVAEAITELCASATVIGVVGSVAVEELIEAFSGVDVGAGLLLLATTRDTWCAVVDRSGPRLVQREPTEEPGAVAFTGDEGSAAQWVMGELWLRGIGVRNTLFVDGRAPSPVAQRDGSLVADPRDVPIAVADPASVLRDQCERRQRGELPWIDPDPGWDLRRDGFDLNKLRVNASLFALADGCIGTSGAPLASHPGSHRWVIAGGTFIGDGPDTRLLTAPIAAQLPYDMADAPYLRRVLDLRSGALFEEVETSQGPLASVRFAALARPGTVVLRAACPDRCPTGPLLAPSDDDAPLDQGTEANATWIRSAGTPGGVVAAATELRRPQGDGRVVERLAVYRTDPDRLPDASEAVAALSQAAIAGFDVLLAEQRAAWSQRWAEADITIEGDDELQRSLRYALFHLMASAPDVGEAAVGARGLSGLGYRGHVFWDAETFTLPFLAATHPAAARAMLEYRIRRLPVARAAARELARKGARFPWESAHSGRDVTPISARDRTGAVVPIRTGQLEDHIVADVAWAACCYADWTGDEEFGRGPGRQLLTETARYWASRVCREVDGAHIYGVIGPDEYHEPVDDNAFTNVIARWNLRRAADLVESSGAGAEEAVEAARWREIADALIDGYDPDTGIYEQFAGFGELEPLIIAEVAPRRPIAADLLLGPDRVRGAQVLKQADVLMLHHLVPDEVEPGSLEPNLRFYEPRTAHGSSLSPGVHASLFARSRDHGRALDALQIASRMDLDDLTETSAGGLHIATMGSLWQAMVFGFGGVRPSAGRLAIEPRLPPDWSALEIRVRFHGAAIRVRVEHKRLTVWADARASISVEGVPYDMERGELQLAWRGRRWEVIA